MHLSQYLGQKTDESHRTISQDFLLLNDSFRLKTARVYIYLRTTMEKAQDRITLTNQVIDTIFHALNLKHIDKNTVTEATSITAGGLNLDSVDILEIIVQLEHKFGIKMSDSEAYAQHFQNIGTVVDFVKSKA